MASGMRAAGGAEKTGFALSTSRTLGACAAPESTDCENALMAAKLLGGAFAGGAAALAKGTAGVKLSRAGWLRPASTRESRALTASALNNPVVCASGGAAIQGAARLACGR